MKYASPVCDSLGRIHQNKCIFEIAKCRSEKIEKVQINQKDCTTIENTNKSNLNNIFKEDLSIYNNFTFDPLVYTFKSNFTNKDTTKENISTVVTQIPTSTILYHLNSSNTTINENMNILNKSILLDINDNIKKNIFAQNLNNEPDFINTIILNNTQHEVENFNASKRTTKKTFSDDLTLTLVTTTPFQSSTNSNYIIL